MNPLGIESPLWVYFSAVAVVAVISWSVSMLKDRYEVSGRRLVRRLHPLCRHCAAHCPDGGAS